MNPSRRVVFQPAARGRRKMKAGGKLRMVWAAVALLLVILAGLTYAAYRRDDAAERARVTSGSQLATTACGPIEYAETGSGPPVLVIHGAGGGFDQGMELAQPLVERGFRVVAVSRFGYLRTPLPADTSPEAQADAHACLLDALGVKKAAVIGGSAGAPSAMQLALRHPERCSALVLLFPMAWAPRPAGTAPAKPPALLVFVMKTTLHYDFPYWAMTKAAPNLLVKTLLATPVEVFRNASAEEQARALRIMRHVLPIREREKGLWNDSTISPALPRYDLEHIATPTLLLAAQDDLYGTYENARYTAEHIPGAKFIGYETGGHLLLGHMTEALDSVTDFLRAHSAPP
jgi:2-hydroxy-6-oxonona-2,4-dienedioate hydrolase